MRTCKLSYTDLRRMLAAANWAHDFFWQEGLYDEALRYAKIGRRIQQAICKYTENKLIAA